MKKFAATGAGVLLAMSLGACAGGGSAGSTGSAAPTEPAAPELEAMIAGAQQDNCLTVYGILDESVLKEVTDRFTELYGVPASFVRLVSADLSQRFATEAEAGATAADVILLTHSGFYSDALSKGWLTPADEAGLPAFEEFPTEYTADDGATPLVDFVPITLVYNSDLVSSVPDSWEVYADPTYENELMFSDPVSSPAQVAFWQLMRDTYGDDYLRAVGENKPTWYNSAVPAAQAVAAGEGALGFPGVQAIVANLQSAGAPLDMVRLSPTTGSEVGIGIAADAPCPSAARLFANFLISEEGNTFLNDVSGDISPYSEEIADFARAAKLSDDEIRELQTLLGSP